MANFTTALQNELDDFAYENRVGRDAVTRQPLNILKTQNWACNGRVIVKSTIQHSLDVFLRIIMLMS